VDDRVRVLSVVSECAGREVERRMFVFENGKRTVTRTPECPLHSSTSSTFMISELGKQFQVSRASEPECSVLKRKAEEDRVKASRSNMLGVVEFGRGHLPSHVTVVFGCRC
jgi:hypothetical protein